MEAQRAAGLMAKGTRKGSLSVLQLLAGLHTSLSPGQDMPAGGLWQVAWAKAGDCASLLTGMRDLVDWGRRSASQAPRKHRWLFARWPLYRILSAC